MVMRVFLCSLVFIVLWSLLGGKSFVLSFLCGNFVDSTLLFGLFL